MNKNISSLACLAVLVGCADNTPAPNMEVTPTPTTAISVTSSVTPTSAVTPTATPVATQSLSAELLNEFPYLLSSAAASDVQTYISYLEAGSPVKTCQYDTSVASDECGFVKRVVNYDGTSFKNIRLVNNQPELYSYNSEFQQMSFGINGYETIQRELLDGQMQHEFIASGNLVLKEQVTLQDQPVFGESNHWLYDIKPQGEAKNSAAVFGHGAQALKVYSTSKNLVTKEFNGTTYQCQEANCITDATVMPNYEDRDTYKVADDTAHIYCSTGERCLLHVPTKSLTDMNGNAIATLDISPTVENGIYGFRIAANSHTHLKAMFHTGLEGSGSYFSTTWVDFYRAGFEVTGGADGALVNQTALEDVKRALRAIAPTP